MSSFSTALAKVIRDAAIDTAGIILSKSVHVLVYADAVDIIERCRTALGKNFLELDKSAWKMNPKSECGKNKMYVLL